MASGTAVLQMRHTRPRASSQDALECPRHLPQTGPQKRIDLIAVDIPCAFDVAFCMCDRISELISLTLGTQTLL